MATHKNARSQAAAEIGRMNRDRNPKGIDLSRAQKYGISDINRIHAANKTKIGLHNALVAGKIQAMMAGEKKGPGLSRGNQCHDSEGKFC